MAFTYIFERDEVLKGKQPDFPNQLPLGAVVETKKGWKAIRFINDKIEIKTRFNFKWDAIDWVRGNMNRFIANYGKTAIVSRLCLILFL